MPVLSFLSRKESPSPVPSSGPSTPAPVFPGGPSPDVHVKHAPPSPASSVPSPKQHDNAPRFIEHVTEGTVDSSSSAIIAPTPLPALTQAPTPPPDATPVITTPTGLTKVDVPPQHPAVAGAGAGLGAPIEAHPDEDGRRQIAMPEPALALAPAPAPVPAPVSTASIGSSSAEPVPIVAPVPVHASPADDPTIVKPSDPVPDAPPGSKSILRNASVRSKHSRGASGARSASPTGKAVGVRTASPTNKAGSLKTAGTASGSTFANGAATVAPFVEPNMADALHERKATAEEELTDKDRAKISKEELKHNRRLSRVIKKEAQAESKALEVALRELTDLQKLQKSAIKDEGTTHAAHARALAAEHKAELAFIAARQAHEKVQAELRSAEEALEASRAHARETTEMLREKAEEVETLRLQKGTDDRERAVRVRELVGDDKKGIGRFFGL